MFWFHLHPNRFLRFWRPLEQAVDLEFALLALELPPAELKTLGPPELEPIASGPGTLCYDVSDDCSEQSRSRQHTLSGETPPVSAATRDVARDVQQPQRQRRQLQHLALSACSAARNSARRHALEALLRQVAELNTRANSRGKGRGDFTVEVLEAAADLYLSGLGAVAEGRAREALAVCVLEGFLGVRRYLETAAQRMLWVDPQLSNNEDLGRCLVAWEDAWELGHGFLLQEELREAFCGLAVETASVRQVCPEMAQLVEEQDAELFLVLPRLVLLSCLWTPSYCALLRALLPNMPWEVLDWQFCELRLRSKDELGFWKLLMASAMKGPGQTATNEFEQSLEQFMLQVEGISMQLQRSKPEMMWNRCCGLLLRSITAAMEVLPVSM
ncbi:unnamed protein product [Effrenium voratum]|nr:unnamed protein product [Effrenium voratum]